MKMTHSSPSDDHKNDFDHLQPRLAKVPVTQTRGSACAETKFAAHLLMIFVTLVLVIFTSSQKADYLSNILMNKFINSQRRCQE